MNDWQPIATCPEGMTVMTKIDDAKGCRNEQPLRKQGWLFFAGDMYVYYQPTHWKWMELEAHGKQ